MLCLLRLLHRNSSTKCHSNQSFIHIQHQVWEFSRLEVFIRSSLWLQPGSPAVWMVYFITARSMDENLYKWWQAGWLHPELRDHCAGTYWYKYSKTGYIWYKYTGNVNNLQRETIIMLTTRLIVKETYQRINEEALVIHQIYQLIIFFLYLFYISFTICTTKLIF